MPLDFNPHYSIPRLPGLVRRRISKLYMIALTQALLQFGRAYSEGLSTVTMSISIFFWQW